MVLDEILSHKRAEVAARKPLGWIPDAGIPASDRSLEQALREPRTGFILECKKASPSRGLIRADFDPVAIAKIYATVADGISVLTDEKYFQGSLDYVTRVRAAVSVPVLCKDFVVDPYQVYEARRYGADAVLLMMSVLDDATFIACFNAAECLSMDALVEVHDEHELDRAVCLGARIIGINNRSFADLSVDLRTTRRLAPKVPSDRVLISESGIASHREISELGEQVDAFLVGSSLMGQQNLREAVNTLVFGRVKVCGLTRREDAVMAFENGAVYGGLIFAPASPRVVSPAQALAIRKDVPLRFVGVFSDDSVSNISRIVREVSLDAVQLHGGEDDAYIHSLRAALPDGCEVWKAVPVNQVTPTSMAAANRMLFDGKSGGSGVSFDWSLLNDMNIADHLLAGGLNPANAAAANRLGAFALDVNSGVEQSPGVKDREKLQQFMQQLRGEGRKTK